MPRRSSRSPVNRCVLCSFQFPHLLGFSNNRISWLYGRVEVRAKLPQGKGVWPAIWMLGDTRGIYLDGFGAVFTTELSPIYTPGLSPFQPNISEQDKAKVRQRKLARLPVVERLMNSMLQSAAKELAAVPDDQQIVVAVKFLYLPYEDTSGLPGQMVVKSSRRAILSGAQIEAAVANQ